MEKERAQGSPKEQRKSARQINLQGFDDTKQSCFDREAARRNMEQH